MFSTVMSAFFSKSLTRASPRGDLRSSVSDFLLALNMWKYHGSSGAFQTDPSGAQEEHGGRFRNDLLSGDGRGTGAAIKRCVAHCNVEPRAARRRVGAQIRNDH